LADVVSMLVLAGANKVLETVASGDDAIARNMVFPGANGRIDSTPGGDDGLMWQPALFRQPPAGPRNGTNVLTADDGPVRLQWLDGSDLGVEFEVAPASV